MSNQRLIVALVLASTSVAFAQVEYKRDFSADLVSQVGGHQTQSKFYASKSRTRMEVFSQNTVRGVTIMDFKNKMFWQLMPERKIAMDMSAMVNAMQANANNSFLSGHPPNPDNPCAALKNYSCQKLGSEDVNGRSTQKWAMKDNNGKAMTAWIDPSLPLAVKTEWEGGSGEFRNIKEAPQPESLFQVPSDYKKSGGIGMPQ
jgi:hypothetical protein